jgi:hypothetical protein
MVWRRLRTLKKQLAYFGLLADLVVIRITHAKAMLKQSDELEEMVHQVPSFIILVHYSVELNTKRIGRKARVAVDEGFIYRPAYLVHTMQHGITERRVPVAVDLKHATQPRMTKGFHDGWHLLVKLDELTGPLDVLVLLFETHLDGFEFPGLP